MHSPQDTPTFGLDIMQAWTRSFHHRSVSRHNHTENKDAEIHGMDIKVDTIQTMTNILKCM